MSIPINRPHLIVFALIVTRTMKAFILVSLLALSSAQLFGGIGNLVGNFLGWNSETYHGLRFEYHRSHHMILVRDQHNCWLVQADKTIEDRFRHKDTKEALEKELYDQIQSHTGEKKEGLQDIRQQYHDIQAVVECIRHNVYELTYMPPGNHPASTPMA